MFPNHPSYAAAERRIPLFHQTHRRAGSPRLSFGGVGFGGTPPNTEERPLTAAPRTIRARVIERARARSTPPEVGDVCEACAELVRSSGAGVIVSSSTGTSTGSYYATSDLSRTCDELQTALGQGPSISAAAEGAPVLVPDLSQPQARRRWPVFADAASAQGLRSLFAFPIGTGVAMLGALTIHRSDTGPLGEEGLAWGLASAEAALDLMLHRSPDKAVPWANGSDLGSHQVEVHQAAGMVSVQLDVTADEAYARLRAHAFRHDLTLAEVAAEVVRRRLRFSPDPAAG